METYEFEGKTDEDAILNACSQLNVTREEMDIEIIEPGSAGIFGLVGGRKAKIRVKVAKEKPEQIDDVIEVAFAQEVPPPVEENTPPLTEEELTAEEENGLAVAKEALENILALIPMEGTMVTAVQRDGTINLNIEGDKSGLLIGRKGRTLDALQFIVNKIVNKSLEKRARVLVDSENYRQRRKDFLIQMALRMGDKAKRIRKPVATNLLNPHDRRIVHLALRDDGELGTKGRGDGILKKVIIIPKKYGNSRPSKRDD
ncbi:MAG: Jag N-terminal domain-containing protein [Deltaproteobacteria bacterium]|nr:Jag N-terminal domain-containing protein [Deltaproteobacteria bacterium]